MESVAYTKSSDHLRVVGTGKKQEAKGNRGILKAYLRLIPNSSDEN